MQNNLVIPQDVSGFLNDNHIIKPPDLKTNNIPKRYYRYVIDSRDRNYGHFPNPNEYQLKLSEDIHDVQSVELLSFDVPFTKYLINASNNTFFYKVGTGTEQSFTIDEGDYETVGELVAELNSKKGGAPFNFTEVEKQSKIKLTDITSNITLLCVGDENMKNGYSQMSPSYKSQLMKLLGLSLENHEITSSEFTFPYKVDMRKDKYMIMNLGQSSVNFSENNTTHKSFAIIKKDDLENKYVDSNYKKYYNPPIPSMATLKISFKDYNGQLYDFQNQDHMIELLFCCFKNQRKYNDIFTE